MWSDRGKLYAQEQQKETAEFRIKENWQHKSLTDCLRWYVLIYVSAPFPPAFSSPDVLATFQLLTLNYGIFVSPIFQVAVFHRESPPPALKRLQPLTPFNLAECCVWECMNEVCQISYDQDYLMSYVRTCLDCYNVTGNAAPIFI